MTNRQTDRTTLLILEHFYRVLIMYVFGATRAVMSICNFYIMLLLSLCCLYACAT